MNLQQNFAVVDFTNFKQMILESFYRFLFIDLDVIDDADSTFLLRLPHLARPLASLGVEPVL